MDIKQSIKYIQQQVVSFCEKQRKWVITDNKATTDPGYGKSPEERVLDEAIRLGVINIDKPPGPTSHQVVAWIKKMLGLKRAGHGGTLESQLKH